MSRALVALAWVGMLGACERAGAPPPLAGSATAVITAPHDASGANDGANDGANIASEVEAAMAEFLAYSESVYAIMRTHGKDCDQAAKELESRAHAFVEIGARMMKVKEVVRALPEQDAARLKRAADETMAAFKARNPDAEMIDQTAKACEKSSAAFAAIAPRVMFVKK